MEVFGKACTLDSSFEEDQLRGKSDDKSEKKIFGCVELTLEG